MADSNYQHPTRHLGEGPDTDGDGLSDAFERRWGSNPDKVDPDGDGLNDWAEWWLDTKPNVADTDGDGYEDGEDLAFGDPLRPNAGGAERAKFIADVRKQFAAEGSDNDGDLVRDYLEDQFGTKRDKADSDGDGISDGVEGMMRSPQHSTPDDTTDLDTAIERLGTQRAASDALKSSDASTSADDGEVYAADDGGYDTADLTADLGGTFEAATAEPMDSYVDDGYSSADTDAGYSDDTAYVDAGVDDATSDLGEYA